MSIQFAPTELLHEIFQYLPKSSLLNCATVCRTWQRPAIQLFYENVELSEKTKQIWLHIVHTPTADTENVGIFVKKLTVSLAFSTTLTQGEFLEVLSYLPFVKAIDLNLSGYKLHYLAYLNKRNTGCVTYLEDINTGDLFTHYQMQQYFSCAYSFRSSLKNLTLRNPYTIYNIDGQSGTALSFLNQFNNLNHVSIINDLRPDNHELTTFLDSFQSCKKLTSFLYQNNHLSLHNETSDDDTSMLDDISNIAKLMKKRQSGLYIPTTKQLQKIEMHVPNLSEHYIKNILTSFPTHLHTFILCMTHTDYRTWIQEHNELFGLYLGYVKNLKISISHFSRRRYIIGSSKKSLQMLSKFWQFILFVIGDRHLSCHLRFYFAKSGTRPDITIERDARNLFLTYNMDNVEEFCACLEEFSPIYSLAAPLANNNKEEPVLSSVVVEIPSHQDDDVNSTRCFEIIKSVTMHRSPPPSTVIVFPTSSNDGYWLQLGSATPIIQQYDNSNSNSKPTIEEPSHLKYALLKNINLQTTSMKTISQMMPHVNTLKLINCKLEKEEAVPNTFTVDISGMYHLNQLVLDFGYLDSDQRRKVLVKVEMDDGQVLCYAGLQQAAMLLSSSTLLKDCDYSSVIVIKAQKVDEVVCVCVDEATVLATLKPSFFLINSGGGAVSF